MWLAEADGLVVEGGEIQSSSASTGKKREAVLEVPSAREEDVAIVLSELACVSPDLLVIDEGSYPPYRHPDVAQTPRRCISLQLPTTRPLTCRGVQVFSV